MNGSTQQRARWVSIEDWLTRGFEDRSWNGRPEGLAIAASPDEILRERRKKSGPGVSHHTNTVPRHRYSA